MIMHDSQSRAVFVDVVPQKGTNSHAIRRISQNLELLEYNQIVFKSHQALATRALKQVVRYCTHKMEIVIEESLAAEHEMNGVSESAVRVVQGMVRSIKIGL